MTSNPTHRYLLGMCVCVESAASEPSQVECKKWRDTLIARSHMSARNVALTRLPRSLRVVDVCSELCQPYCSCLACYLFPWLLIDCIRIRLFSKSAGEIDKSNRQMQNSTGKLLIVIPLCKYSLLFPALASLEFALERDKGDHEVTSTPKYCTYL